MWMRLVSSLLTTGQQISVMSLRDMAWTVTYE
jgi:hypothetical protein